MVNTEASYPFNTKSISLTHFCKLIKEILEVTTENVTNYHNVP